MTNEFLSGLDGLVSLGKEGGLDMKPILLRVITDQFVSQPRHPAADIRQYEELARSLIDDTDVPTAAAVAKRIGAHQDAPAGVIDKLVQKHPDVAAAVFASGAKVDTGCLIERAEWGSTAEAIAIAQRKVLDAKTAAGLARRPESEVLCALAANANAPLDAHALAFLVQRGRTDRELGRVLLARTDIKVDKTPLFLLASTEQRAEMLKNISDADHGPRAMDRRTPQRDLDALADLAAAQKWTLFAIEFAMRLGCDPRGIQEIIRDKSGEPLAIALASLEMEPADAARVFLSCEPDISHSVDRIRGLTRITSDLSPAAARRLISAMLGQPFPSEGARHRRFEHAPDVASLVRRENTLRRTAATQPRATGTAPRQAQRRPL